MMNYDGPNNSTSKAAIKAGIAARAGVAARENSQKQLSNRDKGSPRVSSGPMQENCTDGCWVMSRPAPDRACVCLNGPAQTFACNEKRAQRHENCASCRKGDYVPWWLFSLGVCEKRNHQLVVSVQCCKNGLVMCWVSQLVDYMSVANYKGAQ